VWKIPVCGKSPSDTLQRIVREGCGKAKYEIRRILGYRK
jgi:hypothetical protein